MPGGQQITSGQGSVVAEGGDNNQPVTGSAVTSAQQTVPAGMFIRLRSRKDGGGTAVAALTGIGLTASQGALVRGITKALNGISLTSAQGTLGLLGQATIQWNANGEIDLAGYKVYHGTTNGWPYPDVQNVGNVLSYQWNALARGTTHYFVVTAYDTSSNESTPSAQVSKVIS